MQLGNTAGSAATTTASTINLAALQGKGNKSKKSVFNTFINNLSAL